MSVIRVQGEIRKTLSYSMLEMLENSSPGEVHELKVVGVWYCQVFHPCSFLILQKVQCALIMEANDTITTSFPKCQVTPVMHCTLKPLLSSYPTQSSFAWTAHYLCVIALSPHKLHECSLQSPLSHRLLALIISIVKCIFTPQSSVPVRLRLPLVE